MGIEQRRYKRVTIKSIADIKVQNREAGFQAFLGGISRGGLELYAPEPLEKGDLLSLSLMFLDKDGKNQIEILRGVVKWSDAFESAYIAGIEFDHLIETDSTPFLAAYIENAERYHT